MDWRVLAWNMLSIQFYEKIGANRLDGTPAGWNADNCNTGNKKVRFPFSIRALVNELHISAMARICTILQSPENVRFP